jgi:hypothetical protein
METLSQDDKRNTKHLKIPNLVVKFTYKFGSGVLHMPSPPPPQQCEAHAILSAAEAESHNPNGAPYRAVPQVVLGTNPTCGGTSYCNRKHKQIAHEAEPHKSNCALHGPLPQGACQLPRADTTRIANREKL